MSQLVYNLKFKETMYDIRNHSIKLVLIPATVSNSFLLYMEDEMERVLREDGEYFFYKDEEMLEAIICQATEEGETVLTFFDEKLLVFSACFKLNRNCFKVEHSYKQYVGTMEALKPFEEGGAIDYSKLVFTEHKKKKGGKKK